MQIVVTHENIGKNRDLRRLSDLTATSFPSSFWLILALLAILVMTSAGVLAQTKAKKQVCLTFDELPVARSFGDVDREAVNYLFLDALKRHEVKATGFGYE